MEMAIGILIPFQREIALRMEKLFHHIRKATDTLERALLRPGASRATEMPWQPRTRYTV